jgi:upstream activation factor subunit UAF30
VEERTLTSFSLRRFMAKKTKKKSSVKKASAKKATVKKTTIKKASPVKKTVLAPSTAFMKPLNPSKELAAIVGAGPIPRTEVIKKVWQYIKKYNLQDAKNRRAINADDKLKAIFGGKKQVTMFEMTKLISNHLK